MTKWDERYGAGGDRLFGAAPNEYLREVMARSDFNASSVLCLGDGDGRDGAWLAGQGLAVTAVDISRVATAQALGHDQALGVTVERIAADLAAWRPPAGRSWDGATLFYLQCEAAVRQRAVATAAAALRPGGWFVAEGFAHGVSGAMVTPALGPQDPDLLYDLPALLQALPGFQIIEAFTGTTHLAQGRRHQGPAQVVRLLARRGEG